MIVASRISLVGFIVLFIQSLFFGNKSIANQSENPAPSGFFDTELQAAKAAADRYNPVSIMENREFIGVIINEAGRYRYTVEAGAKGEDRISIKVPALDWENTVAFWHTHGNDRHHHQYFSNTDTALVKRFSKPLYLADYTGKLKLFRPGDRKISRLRAMRLGLPRKRGFALGTEVRDEFNQLVTINTLQGSQNTQISIECHSMDSYSQTLI